MTILRGRADPHVSVIMTAYNDLRFIDAAVESILRQSYADFELIIVDDGTGQHSIFAQQSAKDLRIRIVTNDRNCGTYVSANLAISQSRGEIIARLDADDFSEPSRLARLIEALDLDPGLGLVGSWATIIDEDGGTKGVWRGPVSDVEVRWNALFLNPFCHSSVAFRRACFDAVGGYNTTMRQSEDYVLWARMLEICRAENVPDTLVRYRRNSRGLTASNPPNWRERIDPIQRRSWARLGVDYDADLMPDLTQFISGFEIPNSKMRGRLYRTVLMLLHGFLAAPRALSRDDDNVAMQRLKTTILERIAADRSV